MKSENDTPLSAGHGCSTDDVDLRTPCVDLAHQLLEGRRVTGLIRYGTPLIVEGDERDFGREADEEIADFLIYWAAYRLQHRRSVADLREQLSADLEAKREAERALSELLAQAARYRDITAASLHIEIPESNPLEGWLCEMRANHDLGTKVNALERELADERARVQVKLGEVCVSCGKTGDSGRLWSTVDGRVWCDRHAGGHYSGAVEIPTQARTAEMEAARALNLLADAGLRAQLAAVQRDLADERARLQAVIHHSWKVVFMPSHKDGPWHVWQPGDPNVDRVHVATSDSPRAAIDDARRKQGDEQPR